MKLLLVLGSDKTYDNVSFYLKPLGFELIRYRHVQKAMDNIEEVDPVGIIISATDFPRHWKTMVSFVRYDRTKTECPILLLKGEAFPEEEVSKSMALGINGLILESLEYSAETEKMHSLLSRYISAEDRRKNRRYRPEDRSRIGFVFSHPLDEVLVTGTVKTISSAGISFEPDHPKLTANLALDAEVRDCSLRAGHDILSPVCAVRRTGKNISMEFVSFPGTEKDTLVFYLENMPKEEQKAS
jgi:hypothetical protein